MFAIFLTSIVSDSIHIKWISLSNQRCYTQPTFINLHPNEYSQKLCYNPLAVNLNRCVTRCKILDEYLV